MAVSVTRTEFDAEGLRHAATRAKDAAAARRMRALALVLDGRTGTEAAETCGMDRQTLRDWVHRYNDQGVAGLSDRKAAGPTPRLTVEQQAEVAALVRSGPDLAEHGVVRWRRADLSQVIQARYSRCLVQASNLTRSYSGASTQGYLCAAVLRLVHDRADGDQEAFPAPAPGAPPSRAGKGVGLFSGSAGCLRTWQGPGSRCWSP